MTGKGGNEQRVRVSGGREWPVHKPPSGIPAKGSWPPFERENTAALRHGCYMPRGLSVASPPSSIRGVGRSLCEVVSHCGKSRSSLGSNCGGESPRGWGILGRHSGCHAEDSREGNGGSHDERGSPADSRGTGSTTRANAGTGAGTGGPEEGAVSSLTSGQATPQEEGRATSGGWAALVWRIPLGLIGSRRRARIIATLLK